MNTDRHVEFDLWDGRKVMFSRSAIIAVIQTIEEEITVILTSETPEGKFSIKGNYRGIADCVMGVGSFRPRPNHADDLPGSTIVLGPIAAT